jgi:hypothetical protein
MKLTDDILKEAIRRLHPTGEENERLLAEFHKATADLPKHEPSGKRTWGNSMGVPDPNRTWVETWKPGEDLQSWRRVTDHNKPEEANDPKSQEKVDISRKRHPALQFRPGENLDVSHQLAKDDEGREPQKADEKKPKD